MRSYQLRQYIIICILFGVGILLLKSNLDSHSQLQSKPNDDHNYNSDQSENQHKKDDLLFQLDSTRTSEDKDTNDKQDDEEKVDYHDYKQMEMDNKKSGPGEQGFGIRMQTSNSDHSMQEIYRVNGFNGLVSDKISLERSLRDLRHPECRNKKYPKTLPTVSLIIPFYEEHLSTLLRTFITCVKRSPKGLIKEVILVDDASKKKFLKEQLDNYIGSHYQDLVRIIRSPKREGLIRTRLVGAKEATGDVLIFLDSHCECMYNWLPPLLEPIKKNYRTATCPFIDVINFDTFEYDEQDAGARGAFNWEFLYKRLPRLPEDEFHPAEPFDSPVMAGGLFAISREWFWELGGYDPLLKVWGGEQYEISFKIWMCGGRMVDVPCSRVGHVFRKFNPFGSSEEGDYLGRNMKRVAEVWMDEYKEYIYMRKPNYYKNIDPLDLTDQKALRKKLKCKSFKWFIETIAFDLPRKYPMIEPGFISDGEIRNVLSNLCLNIGQANHNLELTECIKDGKVKSGRQHFLFTWHEDIRIKDTEECFDFSGQSSNNIILMNCHENSVYQKWRYNPVSKHLYNKFHNLCLDANIEQRSVKMSSCGSSKTLQWNLENLNHTFALQVNKIHG